MIFVKRIRRQCGMRGCKNTDTYSLSHFNESAASNIIICKDCLDAALEAVKNCTMPAVDYGRKEQSPPPPLFHNAAVRKPAHEADAAPEPEKNKTTAARKKAVKGE